MVSACFACGLRALQATAWDVFCIVSLYNSLMALTALELPPKEIKKYRPLEAIRKRREAERVARAKRRRRAMRIARKAADILRKEFGARKVILFGSLAKRGAFTLFSDIDLAAEGIPSLRYFEAVARVTGFTDFINIDLVEFETCPPALRANIEKDGKPL